MVSRRIRKTADTNTELVESKNSEMAKLLNNNALLLWCKTIHYPKTSIQIT